VLKTVLISLSVLYLFVFGVIAAIRPVWIRAFCVRQYASVLSGVEKSGLSFDVEKLAPRASTFRIFGVISLALAALLLYTLLRH
jgi:hypothetical protein